MYPPFALQNIDGQRINALSREDARVYCEDNALFGPFGTTCGTEQQGQQGQQGQQHEGQQHGQGQLNGQVNGQMNGPTRPINASPSSSASRPRPGLISGDGEGGEGGEGGEWGNHSNHSGRGSQGGHGDQGGGHVVSNVGRGNRDRM